MSNSPFAQKSSSSQRHGSGATRFAGHDYSMMLLVSDTVTKRRSEEEAALMRAFKSASSRRGQ
jgi:hypothetical protein